MTAHGPVGRCGGVPWPSCVRAFEQTQTFPGLEESLETIKVKPLVLRVRKLRPTEARRLCGGSADGPVSDAALGCRGPALNASGPVRCGTSQFCRRGSGPSFVACLGGRGSASALFLRPSTWELNVLGRGRRRAFLFPPRAESKPGLCLAQPGSWGCGSFVTQLRHLFFRPTFTEHRAGVSAVRLAEQTPCFLG